MAWSALGATKSTSFSTPIPLHTPATCRDILALLVPPLPPLPPLMPSVGLCMDSRTSLMIAEMAGVVVIMSGLSIPELGAHWIKARNKFHKKLQYNNDRQRKKYYTMYFNSKIVWRTFSLSLICRLESYLNISHAKIPIHQKIQSLTAAPEAQPERRDFVSKKSYRLHVQCIRPNTKPPQILKLL